MIGLGLSLIKGLKSKGLIARYISDLRNRSDYFENKSGTQRLLNQLKHCELTFNWGENLLQSSELEGHFDATNILSSSNPQNYISSPGVSPGDTGAEWSVVQNEGLLNPFGETTGVSRLVLNGGPSNAHLYADINFPTAGSGSQSYEMSTRSIWVKGPSGKKTYFNTRHSALNTRVLFELNGDWQRSIVETDPTDSHPGYYYIVDNRDGGTLEAGDEILVYSPQVELTSFASSFPIPGATTISSTLTGNLTVISYNNTPEPTGSSLLFKQSTQYIFQNYAYTPGQRYLITIEGEGNVRFRTGYANDDGVSLEIELPFQTQFIATSDSNRFQIWGSVLGEGEVTRIELNELISETA